MQNKIKETTHDRCMKDIKKLKGEYNGWWMYQYAMGDFTARVAQSKILGYNKSRKKED